jgi:flagellar biosynthetic protein FliP
MCDNRPIPTYAGDQNKTAKAGRKRVRKALLTIVLAVGIGTALSVGASAAPADVVNAIFGEDAQTLDIVLLMTALMLIPSLLICMTCFTRIIIVLSFVRSAIGLQNSPPNQVLIGLALFLTYFVMHPVITQINETAYAPYNEGQIGMEEFIETAIIPIRGFMLEQTYKTDLDFFAGLDHMENVDDINEIPNRVVIPAFLTSELKRAFQIGFFLFIPFIVIDMVVSSTLMAMGMMMLPPAMISMPFKILLFVLVDGWQLTLGTLIKSFA